jgi:hypothetical protein
MATSNLPPCGIFRTTLPLEGRETQVPSGRLVYFHNHSEQNKPIVLLPQANTDNRWTFQDRGYLVENNTWVNTMVPLPPQGFYLVKREISVAGGGSVSQGLLVQLGYNTNGEAILFPGTLEPGNRIQFPDRGVKLSDLQIDLLEPAAFRLVGPQNQQGGDLH